MIEGRTDRTRLITVLKESEVASSMTDVYREYTPVPSTGFGSPEDIFKPLTLNTTCYFRRRFFIDGKEREVFLPDWLNGFLRKYEGMSPIEEKVTVNEIARLEVENKKLKKRLRDANI